MIDLLSIIQFIIFVLIWLGLGVTKVMVRGDPLLDLDTMYKRHPYPRVKFSNNQSYTLLTSVNSAQMIELSTQLTLNVQQNRERLEASNQQQLRK